MERFGFILRSLGETQEDFHVRPGEGNGGDGQRGELGGVFRGRANEIPIFLFRPELGFGLAVRKTGVVRGDVDPFYRILNRG